EIGRADLAPLASCCSKQWLLCVLCPQLNWPALFTERVSKTLTKPISAILIRATGSLFRWDGCRDGGWANGGTYCWTDCRSDCWSYRWSYCWPRSRAWGWAGSRTWRWADQDGSGSLSAASSNPELV